MSHTRKGSVLWLVVFCAALPVLMMASCNSSDTPAETKTHEKVGDEMAAADTSTMDIVDTAVAAGNFNTLASALEAAGLVSTLKGEGPFTVFAPTDEAFGKLPHGTVEDLLRPENRETLRNVLTSHVVSGKVMSSDVVKLDSAEALSGMELPISVSGGTVQVASATVTAADVECSNGVIHVIDTVILPPQD